MKKLLLVLAFLGLTVGSASATCSGPAVMHDFPGTSFNMSLATNSGDGNCASNVAIPSGAVASGAYSAGAYAAGALAAGAFASGAGVDGWDSTQGAKTDAVCATSNGTCSVIALVKFLNAQAATIATNTGAAIPAGTALIGGVEMFDGAGAIKGTIKAASTQSASTDTSTVVQLNPNQPNLSTPLNVAFGASASGGATPSGEIAPNNTTAVVVKGSAGTLYGAQLAGIGSAPAYVKIYNAASATCGSGTPVKRLMIPAASTAANGAGSNISFGPSGIALGTGITYCVTTGISDIDTTAPPASTYLVNLDFQ